MIKTLSFAKSIVIDSTPEQVWDALINPEKIKVYLFGTEAISDWKVGSPIIFQGKYQGHKYKDKGNVLECTKFESIKYNYWSGFSGLEDKIENYSIIDYTIKKLSDTQVEFTWAQTGFSNDDAMQHSVNTLGGMLEQIKKLVEEE